jgi:hypothetical protein
MQTAIDSLEIHGVPDYVSCWSAAGIRGFLPAVLERWQRNGGAPPARFALVICPLVEVLARGGLPDRVIERTTPRLRFHHFTGCHKPFVVLLHDSGEDDEAWCREVQQELAWSESYRAEFGAGVLRLQFVEAVEECEGNLGTGR